jgi:hypothetical protein
MIWQENPAPRDTTVAVLLLAPTASRCVRTYIRWHCCPLGSLSASVSLPAARRCLRCRSQRLWPRLPLMASRPWSGTYRALGATCVFLGSGGEMKRGVVGRGGWTSSSALSPSISCSQAWSAHLQQQQRHFSANCCRSFELLASGLLREY